MIRQYEDSEICEREACKARDKARKAARQIKADLQAEAFKPVYH